MTSALRPSGSTSRWRRIRAAVLRRDDYRCQAPAPTGVACGRPATTAGHIVPRDQGGTDHPDNLRAECAPCNYGDGARLANAKRATPTPGLNPSRDW